MPELIRPADISTEQTYRLITGIVVPRPVAWITTLSLDGSVNLAPFSAYMMLANRPCLVGISVGVRDGVLKDTMQNIDRTGELVVNVPRWVDLEHVHESSGDFAMGTSETAHLDLDVLEGIDINVPRLADSKIALECTLENVLDVGEDGHKFVIARVVLIHAADGLVRDGKIDTGELDPLGRLAGPNYVRVSEVGRARKRSSLPRT